jgi:hypothetical protein
MICCDKRKCGKLPFCSTSPKAQPAVAKPASSSSSTSLGTGTRRWISGHSSTGGDSINAGASVRTCKSSLRWPCRPQCSARRRAARVSGPRSRLSSMVTSTSASFGKGFSVVSEPIRAIRSTPRQMRPSTSPLASCSCSNHFGSATRKWRRSPTASFKIC